MTKSYTFNGIINNSISDWKKWVEDAKYLCELLGYNANYYDIGIINKNGGKIRTIKSIEKRINNIEKKQEIISGISILVLPDDYESASFDYIITLSKNANYVTLIINTEYPMNVKENIIIEKLKEHLCEESGEIYEMDIFECPEFYAGKANPPETYKSLKIIRNLL